MVQVIYSKAIERHGDNPIQSTLNLTFLHVTIPSTIMLFCRILLHESPLSTAAQMTVIGSRRAFDSKIQRISPQVTILIPTSGQNRPARVKAELQYRSGIDDEIHACNHEY